MEHKNHNESESKYESLFLLFTTRVEKALTVIVFILMFAVAVSQMMLPYPQIRYLLVKVERLEGNPYSEAAPPTVYQIGN